MRTCAKFILAGEHSIVHGGRALGFPLPALEMELEESDAWQGLILNGEPRSAANFAQYLSLRQRLGITRPTRGARVESKIPIGAGLGSSAALCVALSRWHFPQESTRETALRALEGERSFHGRPSGLDPFIVAYGHPLLFESQQLQVRRLDLQQALKAGLCFVLRDSGLRHQTWQVLEALEGERARAPERVTHALETLSTNAEAALSELENGKLAELGRILTRSHETLCSLGLSAPEIENCVQTLLQEGALGAKLTGAGCGGFALGVFEETRIPQTLQPSDLVLNSQTLADFQPDLKA